MEINYPYTFIYIISLKTVSETASQIMEDFS